MAQKRTFDFKAANTTRSLNGHVAGIIGWGTYNGFEVVKSGDMTVTVKLGNLFTDEGIKISEEADVGNTLTLDVAPGSDYRVDTVVLNHRYAIPPAGQVPASATYRVIKGAIGAEYEVTPDVGSLVAGDVPLAEVLVRPGTTSISPDDIRNFQYAKTTPHLRKEMADSIYAGMGNFCTSGWNLSAVGAPALTVQATPGSGFLGGVLNESAVNSVTSTLRVRETLLASTACANNLSLTSQPDYASKLRFEITATAALNTTVTVAGTAFTGDPSNLYAGVAETLNIVQAAGTTVEYSTANYFHQVAPEGLDFGGAVGATMTVTDRPIHRVIASGTGFYTIGGQPFFSGRVRFKAIVDPSYNLSRNELLLGWAETNATCIIQPITEAPRGSRPTVVEDLSPQCNAVRTSFFMEHQPAEGSEIVVMDGMTLRRNSAKGYTLVGRQITLGPRLEAPDGVNTETGDYATDLWVRYVRAF